MTKTLLLITESFPPLNTIAAQRFPPMLPVLEAAGWQVFVLTKQATGPLAVRLPEEQILRIGWHHQEGLAIRADSNFSRGSRARAVLRRIYNATGLTLYSADSSLLTWRRSVGGNLDRLRTRVPRVDVVIGTYRPAASLWLARRLGGLYGAPWIADFRDLAALRPNGRRGYTCWLDRRIEARLLRSAAALTTCGTHWAAMLETTYGRPTHVLYNGWDLEHFVPTGTAGALEAVRASGGRPYLYFAGRFYERQMEAVRRLLAAVRGTPFVVVVRSLGPVECDATVSRQAEQLGVADQLRLLPPVPLATAQAEAQAAAANLVLEAVDIAEDWTRGHLSGKFLQLVPLAPPVLFVARSDSEAKEILRRTGRGVLCTSVEEISAGLGQLASGELGRSVDPTAVAEFSKVRQGERLLALLEAVRARAASLGRPRHRAGSHAESAAVDAGSAAP